MKLEVGKSYKTRSGRIAKIIHKVVSPLLLGGPYMGQINFGEGCHDIFNWWEDGAFLDGKEESQLDLVDVAHD